MDDFFWKIKLKFRTLWYSPSGKLMVIGIGMLSAGLLLLIPSGGFMTFLKNTFLVIAAWAGFLFGGFLLALITGGIGYGLVYLLDAFQKPLSVILLAAGAVLLVYGFLKRKGIIRPNYKYKEVKPEPVISHEWKDYEGKEPLETFTIDNVYDYSEYEIIRHVKAGTEVKVHHLDGSNYDMTAGGKKICDKFTHIYLNDRLNSSNVMFVIDNEQHFDEDTGPVCVLTIGIF